MAQAIDTTCVICGGPLDWRKPGLATRKPVVGGEIRRCTVCGSHQVRPLPSPARLAELYVEDYYEEFLEGPGLVGGNFEASEVLQRRLERLESMTGKGKLLDVGCGVGHFVKFAADRGWSAAGLETSAWAAQQGRRRGAVIYSCSLSEAPIEPGSLDVVHANHVVEHMLDPVAELRAARRLLRDGGWLVIEVPQEVSEPLSDRLSHRIQRSAGGQAGVPITHHLVFFTPKGMAVAARRAGFKVVRVSTVRHVRSNESRLPFGVVAKRLTYRLEEALHNAPDIELWATAGR